MQDRDRPEQGDVGRFVARNFRVDLSGMVDILSRHLYSSPRVYLRELVQNAVDAVAARERVEPGCPRRVLVVPADVAPDGRLEVSDSGIGLDADGIADVLATIGRSSKRDDLGRAREGFIGQFGIGLLSCFLVTDEVELDTRAVGADTTLRWTGRSDGTYDVAPSPEPLPEPGTRVRLAPAPTSRDLLGLDVVRHLLTTTAAFLPVDLVLRTHDGLERPAGRAFPWDDPGLVGIARRAAAAQLCEDLLGFAPLDVVELSDPPTGTRGLAFVTPDALGRAAHRVHVHRMLLAESCENVLPDWAFFVRAVLDTDGLHPTASREALFEDDVLEGARDRLGAQLRGWLARLAATRSPVLTEFLHVHQLAAKAVATHDDTMLDIVAGALTFESTVGDVTLEEITRTDRVLRYTTSVEDFRQVAPVAVARGLPVLDAGYAYDVAIVTRWAARHPAVEPQRMAPTDLLGHLEAPDPAEAAGFARLLEVARRALGRAGCAVELRTVDPAHLPALLLTDRAARRERERELVAADSDALWGELLGSVATDRRPTFVLNAHSLTVRRLADRADASVQEAAVEALYAHALVAGRHRLRPVDAAVVARALPTLIDRLLDVEDDRDPRQEPRRW